LAAGRLGRVEMRFAWFDQYVSQGFLGKSDCLKGESFAGTISPCYSYIG